MAAVGLAFIVYLFSLMFKYSFGVGFFIWFLLVIIAAVAEEHEKSEKAEGQAKENEMRATRPCPMCAERIKLEAKKCRFCSEHLCL